ncbi:TetR/AcrR family transcriptional regulator [Endozoicomonas sp. OPT23]|uniref:TetR/AcrR family transcriptional regulator n=1 Tax=Endozoicomonas sp. OPT23 TaxID=2072845 RepID=UPI00129B61D4|nr:TetR/AcrR family transcriptional regulator [Endozoicomonas sp. OPT23]MRI31440.1 TetR/AcrR family transcriptional regulator [Endozoicomonas sp. OPT23]
MNKQTQLIDAALQLFYEKGINSVGINEVLKTTGIAKKTLYNHFKSKDELVLAALKKRDQQFLIWLDRRLEEADSKEKAVVVLFESLTDWFHNQVEELPPFRGCFFINSAIECGVVNNEIAAYCKDHKQQVRQLLSKRMSHLSDEVLDVICTLKEGAIVMAYVAEDKNAAMKCLPSALTLVAGN